MKSMEHESDGDANCDLCARNNHQRIGSGTGALGNKNTQRSSGDLRILAVTQTPVENRQLTPILKTFND